MIRLINCRFVAFAFDLSPIRIENQDQSIGAMCDLDARSFALAADPEVEGTSVPTPPVLVVTGAGEVVRKISNYADEEQFLHELLEVLDEHPEWNDDRDLIALAAAADSRPLDVAAQLALSSARMDAGQSDRAIRDLGRLLLKCEDDRGRELILRALVHAARVTKNLLLFDSATKRLGAMKLPPDPDLELELAHVLLLRKEFERALKSAQSARSSASPDRRAEADYLVAAAQWGLGRSDDSKQTLRELIANGPEGPWVYRADWGLTSIEQPTKRSWSTTDPKTQLGRVGYMGRINPDFALQRPRASSADGD